MNLQLWDFLQQQHSIIRKRTLKKAKSITDSRFGFCQVNGMEDRELNILATH
jgi:hypothetical protein